jgi:hypothetical protein
MGAHFAVIAAGNGPQMVIASERFALDNSTIAPRARKRFQDSTTL